MKKLVLIIFTIMPILAFCQFSIKNPVIQQTAFGDTLTTRLQADSVKITTTKDFISFNKPLKINGDTVMTGTTIDAYTKAQTRDLMSDSLGAYVDTISNQTIKGSKTFTELIRLDTSGDKYVGVLNGNTMLKNEGVYILLDDDSLYLVTDYQASLLITEDSIIPSLPIRGYYTTTEVRSEINDSLNLAVRLIGDQSIDGEKIFNDTLTADFVKTKELYINGYPSIVDNGGGTVIIKGFEGQTDFIQIDDGATVIYGNNGGFEWLGENNGSTYMYGINGNDFLKSEAAKNSIWGITGDGDGISFIGYTPTTTTIARGDTTFITMTKDTLKLHKVVASDSVLYAPAIYGEIIVDSGFVAQTIVDSTYIKLTAFNTEGESNLITAVADSVIVLRDGIYEVDFELSLTPSVKQVDLKAAVFINGIKTNCQDKFYTQLDSEAVNLMASRFLSINAGDILTIKIYHNHTVSNDITVHYGRLGCKYMSNQ
jgi:hypothetical protein